MQQCHAISGLESLWELHLVPLISLQDLKRMHACVSSSRLLGNQQVT